ncbi:MAG: 3-hydroxybutyrate dehydrogenase [Actinomycetales bacterium]|nr:3-hydroxybutyrate dehydrogenase [Actinomycetales bacterium]
MSQTSADELGFLRGRTALVTGAMGGIGSGIAVALAESGMRLILHDRQASDRDAKITEQVLGVGAMEAEVVHFDLADGEQSAAGFAALASQREVDIVVNAAGIQRTAELGVMTRQTWNDIIAINLSAAFDSTSAFLPGMKERGYGRIINISSVHGLVASREKAAYVSAKHGLIGLTRVAALECAAAGSAASGGVTVNAICPGWVHTPLIEDQIQALAARLASDRDAAVQALVQEKVPSLRMSEPSDVGGLALFLCQRQAHNINGASLTMDGGWTAV